ncbi:MAG: arylsulfatase [Phycisphaerae bacterium]|nr:arylsulfatase [Phycisphaerae bacterium]
MRHVNHCVLSGIVGVWCGLAGSATAFAAGEARRPNVVIVLADDQGWGDLSVHGNKNIRTPHIDSLATEGALFDRFYVSPVCSPTRASLLTGRYHVRMGVTGTGLGQERMNLDEVTMGDVFKAAGYATGCFGKWHNGSQYPYHPNGRGFDEFYGFTCGHWSNYFDPPLEHNGQEVRGKGYITDDLTDKAMAFMSANRDRPFLCYVAYNTPHSPFQVPDEYWDRLQKRELRMFNRDKGKEELVKTRAALAMCENIDWNVGRILSRLDELKLADDTIVIYFSDNGPNTWRWNDGMLGRKGSVQEGGVRSPLLIRWPGRVRKGVRIGQIASHIDLLPTLADLAGVSTARCKRLDGVSLRPLLEGRTEGWPDRMIFSAWNKQVSVRTQQYRADGRALYDMKADPGQRTNVVKLKPDVYGRLAEGMRKWQKEVIPAVAPDRPYPVGHRERAMTVLPAQECVFRGKGLRFSSRHPNCSWVTDWTDGKAYVSWDIEVLTAGRYEATLLYTCAAGDVGSEIELEFGGKKLGGKIAEAFDPPLIDSPDRAERSESYDKPFKPLVLGEIELAAGRGQLVLRALSKAGKRVMDVRGVRLRRL